MFLNAKLPSSPVARQIFRQRGRSCCTILVQAPAPGPEPIQHPASLSGRVIHSVSRNPIVHGPNGKALALTVPAGQSVNGMKSVNGTNIEIVGDRVRIAPQPSGPMDVEIVLGTNGGQLSGVVATSSGKALSNVTVLLAPDDPALMDRRDLYRSTVTDASARYRFGQLPPGDYRLFSWQDVEQDIWFNPSFMTSIQDLGKTVCVAEGGRSEINLAALPVR
jgi:hypothetical protein